MKQTRFENLHSNRICFCQKVRKTATFPIHLFNSHKTYLDNEIDVHPLKPVSTAFIAFQRAKKSG